jgi:DNA replication and repair protein RecF
MGLTSLQLRHFRNLHQVEFQPGASLNVITGDNAAGKTSLLESIFYLSFARSFRTSHTKDLISHGQEMFRLVARLDDPQAIIGIQKSPHDQLLRINQQTVHRVSDLSALFPVIALHPDSHQLITEGPEFRRQFLDWGVFHVEHDYINLWRDFRKALSQRNAALRANQSDRLCLSWDSLLAEQAQKMSALRNGYLELLKQAIDNLRPLMFPDNAVSLDYRGGWPEDQDYQAYLQQNLTRDREKGYTLAGPHRADIRIRLDDKPVQTAISRGQQKKLVTLLKLAQMDVFTQTSGKRCVLLYDDLPAELDQQNRANLLKLLANKPVQVFVTATDIHQIDMTAWQQTKLFHVEHGKVSEA